MHAWFPAGRLSGSKNWQNLLSKNFEDLCVVSWYTFNDCFRLPEWVNSSKLLMPTLNNLLLAEYPKVKGWNLPIIQENADSVKWWWLLFCLLWHCMHAWLHAALVACTVCYRITNPNAQLPKNLNAHYYINSYMGSAEHCLMKSPTWLLTT